MTVTFLEIGYVAFLYSFFLPKKKPVPFFTMSLKKACPEIDALITLYTLGRLIWNTLVTKEP